MAQRGSVLDASALQKVIDVLHANGYRLRSVGTDSVTVAESGPALEVAPAQRHDGPTPEELEAEELKWLHVGGKPAFLREPKPREANPWVDTHPEGNRS